MMKEKDLGLLMEQLKKESEPFALTNKMVENPCLPCCACYFFLILCGFICMAAGYLNPGLEGDRDYDIWLDPIQVDYDKMNLATQYLLDTQGATGVPIQSETTGSIIFIYKFKDDECKSGDFDCPTDVNLFNIETFKQIKAVEDDVMS